jgi:hypothetical protein
MVFPERSRTVRGPGRVVLVAGVLGAIFLASACSSEDPIAVPDDEVIDPSLAPQVKRKSHDRLQNDLARALSLDPGEVCNELGRYPCTEQVHRIALGGSSPYELGLFEPLPFTALTSPIAAERVAMAACVTRVDRDLAGEALIFADLDIDARGRLARVQDGAVAAAIDTLYKRAVQRRASAREIEHLRRLYRDIEDQAAARPARDWAVLSCFAVMTTMEQLFY